MTVFQFPETKNKMKEVNSNNPLEEDEMDWTNKNCFTNEILKIKARTGVLDIKQSPINIDSHNVEECHLLCDLEIHYKPSKCHIEKTPQGIIRLHWDTGSHISYNKINYELKYIYFHTPSMHLIDNNSSQMEINFYHVISEKYLPNEKPNNLGKNANDEEYSHEAKEIKNIKKKSLEKDKHAHDDENDSQIDSNLNKGVIISILVNHNDEGIDDHQKKSLSLGTKENIFIGQFANNEKFLNLNRKNNKDYKHRTIDIDVHKDWNIRDLIPKKKSFYKYEGSLPFPPCTQGYTWVVFDNHIRIIEKFIHNIRKIGNPKGNREPHPLNDRRVYYNNNVLIEEKEEDETETKNKMVKKILAPIRIQVEDKDGEIYRKEANEIVNSYTYGDNRDYYNDEEIAKNISTKWNEASKLGFVDETAETYNTFNDEEKKKFYENVVWDYNKFSTTDYLTYFLKNENNKNNEELVRALSNNRIKLINAINKLTSTRAMFYDNNFDAINNLNYTNFNITNISSVDLVTLKKATPSISEDELQAFKDVFGKTTNKKILYLLLDWHDEYVDDDNGKVKLFTLINDPSFKNECMKNIITHFSDNSVDSGYSDDLNNIVFRSRTTDLETTVEGHSCQRWGSNEVHHEGSIFNIFSAKVNVPKEGYTWEEIGTSGNEPTLKKMIRDGTLSYDSEKKKWLPHNKCRNPGNSATAPWCYTTNPDERWAYCLKPDIKIHTKKYIMIAVFLMIVFLSYYMVTLIFRHELFTEFVAALTGAQTQSNNTPPGQGGTGGR